MEIKASCGFWNVTRYPYGGDFGRAPRLNGLAVELVERDCMPAQAKVRLLEDYANHHKKGDLLVVRHELLSGLI